MKKLFFILGLSMIANSVFAENIVLEKESLRSSCCKRVVTDEDGDTIMRVTVCGDEEVSGQNCLEAESIISNFLSFSAIE